MTKIRGPAIFLAQFFRDEKPFDTLLGIAEWAKELGYVGVQVPSWDERAIDLNRAATSRAYCDEYRGKLAASRGRCSPSILRTQKAFGLSIRRGLRARR
jgi:sugar phosphate isomerase/epimerase